MDYSVVFAFSLLILGLALIVAELFIPSGGIISLLAIVCLAASLYSAHEAWWDQSPSQFWWFLGSIVGLIPLTIGGTLFLISRTRLGNRVLLEAPKLEEVTPYSREAEVRKKLIGKQGKTLTMMAPGGLVIVDSQRHHAETEGQMLDPEQPIQVIAVKGNRVVVRPYEPQTAEPQAAEPQTAEPQAAEPQTAEPQAAEPSATSSNGKNSPAGKTPSEKPTERPSPSADLAETQRDSSQVPLDFEIPES